MRIEHEKVKREMSARSLVFLVMARRPSAKRPTQSIHMPPLSAMKAPRGSLFAEPFARAVLLLVFVSSVGGFILAPHCSARKCADREQAHVNVGILLPENIFRRVHPLGMGKGFNSAKNKQLELAKKMALAKKQHQPENTDPTQQMDETTSLSAEAEKEGEKRLQADRARFAELLRTTKVSNPNPLYEDDELDSGEQSRRAAPQPLASITARAGALSAKRKVGSSGTNAKKRQKKANAKKAQAEEDDEDDDEGRPLQEGDIASRYDFDRLISCETGSPLGPMLSAQLVPWVPPFIADYLIILADPRAQSSDLRRSVQYVSSNTSPDVRRQVIAITADDVSVTQSWIDRTAPQTGDDADGDGNLLRMFSDRDWEWMRRYSAVDDGRWSMSMVVIDSDAVIRRVIRDVDPSHVCQLLVEVIEAIK